VVVRAILAAHALLLRASTTRLDTPAPRIYCAPAGEYDGMHVTAGSWVTYISRALTHVHTLVFSPFVSCYFGSSSVPFRRTLTPPDRLLNYPVCVNTFTVLITSLINNQFCNNYDTKIRYVEKNCKLLPLKFSASTKWRNATASVCDIPVSLYIHDKQHLYIGAIYRKCL
jgi:hypothetical protein